MLYLLLLHCWDYSSSCCAAGICLALGGCPATGSVGRTLMSGQTGAAVIELVHHQGPACCTSALGVKRSTVATPRPLLAE